MAITLETSIKRFIGASTDAKPHVGDANADGSLVTSRDLPVGSTLYLKDLGIIERWDGDQWSRDPASTVAAALTGLAEELQRLHILIVSLRLGMIDAGTCNEVFDQDLVSAA